MGFCVPAQPVWDARHHGVALRLVDVPRGHWRTTLEGLSKARPSGLADLLER